MTITVKVDRLCFIGGHRRRPGSVFQLPEGMKPAEWMEVIKKGAKVEAEVKAPAEPETFSQITAIDAKAQDVKGDIAKANARGAKAAPDAK